MIELIVSNPFQHTAFRDDKLICLLTPKELLLLPNTNKDNPRQKTGGVGEFVNIISFGKSTEHAIGT